MACVWPVRALRARWLSGPFLSAFALLVFWMLVRWLWRSFCCFRVSIPTHAATFFSPCCLVLAPLLARLPGTYPSTWALLAFWRLRLRLRLVGCNLN